MLGKENTPQPDKDETSSNMTEQEWRAKNWEHEIRRAEGMAYAEKPYIERSQAHKRKADTYYGKTTGRNKRQFNLDMGAHHSEQAFLSKEAGRETANKAASDFDDEVKAAVDRELARISDRQLLNEVLGDLSGNLERIGKERQEERFQSTLEDIRDLPETTDGQNN